MRINAFVRSPEIHRKIQTFGKETWQRRVESRDVEFLRTILEYLNSRLSRMRFPESLNFDHPDPVEASPGGQSTPVPERVST
jgi:hypothetical protein